MQSISQKLSKALVSGLFALLVTVAVAIPQANAQTSAGATIHNAVEVTYQTGAAVFTALATVDVKVTTLASLPNLSAPTGVAVLPGAADAYAYVYTIVSTANGPDTYAPSTPTVTDTGISGANPSSITGPTPNPVTLWGGVTLGTTSNTVAAGGGGTMTIPAGSEAGLTAGTTVVRVGGVDYLVTAIAPAGGNPAIAAATGLATPEVSAVLTLVPLAGAPVTSLPAGLVGTQVGEVGHFTVTLTAGNPNIPGTPGSVALGPIGVTTGTTGPGGTPLTTAPAGETPVVTSTVPSPNLTIKKDVRNVTAAGTFPVTPGDPAAPAVSGRPGEVLEYRITVSNLAAATASAVSISDAIPVYTALVAGSIQLSSNLGGVAVGPVALTIAPGVDAAMVVNAGLTAAGTGIAGDKLVVNIGTGANIATVPVTASTGSLAATDKVTILYQVTVQ